MISWIILDPSEEDPDGLIIVEGLDFATDLRGVKQSPLHTEPRLKNRSLDAAVSGISTLLGNQ
jgi:hypothetical protein